MKLCNACGKTKPLSEFYQRTAKSRGKSKCKICYRDYVRVFRLVKKYGITLDEYNELLAKQEGKCAICKTDTNSYGDQDRWFAVDHNHKTGKVRGLLCQTCNRMLGLGKDSIDILKSATAYLEKYEV